MSVDPYMRPYVSRLTTPFTMIGMGVYKIRESRDTEYPQGGTVVANIGWVKTAIVNSREIKTGLRLMPDQMLAGISPSKLLGALGMPGNTAYFGFLELCQPKEGETVVVNGAAGAVGSLVGQIAKIKGCKVIGIAGSEEKCSILTDQLGFDVAINYNKQNIKSAVRRAAPTGVNCYFDNVGGAISQAVLVNMAMYGRVAVCGAITGYNGTSPTLLPALQPLFVSFQINMEGFFVWRWLHNGRETVVEG